MQKNIFDDFTGLYPLSKTLRFELKPIGKTLENIKNNHVLEDDQLKAEEYIKTKKIIDDFHRYFIDYALEDANLDWTDLAKSIKNYQKNNDPKELEQTQSKFRKQIVKLFTKQEVFGKMFKKDLFSEVLPKFLGENKKEELDSIKTFDHFSTYFTTFQENRRNIYSDENKDTAIANRLVDENFPKFLANITIYNNLCKICPEVLEKAEKELKNFLDGIKLKDIFQINFYNKLLTQKGIDRFNTIIGGQSFGNTEKNIQGINVLTNLFKQKQPDFNQNKSSVKMLPLYKQILSDVETFSFVQDKFISDEDVLKSIESYYKEEIASFNYNNKKINVLISVENIFKNINNYDLSLIKINKIGLSKISKDLFNDWQQINSFLFNYYESKFGSANKKTNADKIKQELNKKEFSLAELNAIFEFNKGISGEKHDANLNKYWKILNEKSEDIRNCFKKASLIFDKQYKENESWKENDGDVETIKLFLDSLQDYLHAIKIFVINEASEKDTNFYTDFLSMYEQLNKVSVLYDMTRNYVTQKNIDKVKKIKLNFDCPTLADGWDANKETDNNAILMIKNNFYYLGIFNAKNKPKIKIYKNEGSNSNYKKIVYKLLPGPNKMLPKVFLSKKGQKNYNPPKEILDGYLAGKHKKGDVFDKKFCHQLIDFFKESISKHPDWKNFNFNFSETNAYDDISDFYKEVAKQGYKISFVYIDEEQINQLINNNQLYLFQIYNKDFAQGAHGKENLHTLYWKELFSPENLKNIILKLNGEAELFYRPQVVKKAQTHKYGEKLLNRCDKNGEPIPDENYDELFKYFNHRTDILSEESKQFLDKVVVKDVKKNHEIIKDRRYAKEKFLFHAPITINFKADGSSYINEQTNKLLSEKKDDVNVIGIDRGERNLIYASLINSKGEILIQKSFNIVNSYDYHKKLDQKEKYRQEARKSWKKIGNIKNLKEGYLSAVVHEIATMMINHNAIVVLEDLNYGFKRGRFKVEKQVYQKFEKMLIDKLNYMTFKNRNVNEPGGLLRGYQLTNQFKSFERIGKQSGFLFYIPAAYTSKIDPTTGFTNLFLNLKYQNTEKAKEFFSVFKDIRFNSQKEYFEFSFNYDNFRTVRDDYKKEWIVCTINNKCFYFDNKNRKTMSLDLTKEIRQLFDFYKINYQNNQNLISAIISQDSADFYKKLIWLFRLTLQMRNSNVESGDDFILSPVINKSHEFYDSRHEMAKGLDKNGYWISKLPVDADANGAFNIALKGLYLLRNRIDDISNKTVSKINLKIDHHDWLKYVQTKNN